MAKFLTTSAISYEIEKTLKTAKQKLVLISPYLQLSENLLERLQDANRRDVEINIIYGKSELNSAEEEKLTQLSNVRLNFHKNLHAKCYYNEHRAVVGSMNMYEFSEKNNREMGVLLTSQKDRAAFLEMIEEADSIVNAAEVRHLNIDSSYSEAAQKLEDKNHEWPNDGFCIRCRKRCWPDQNRPLCFECFLVWHEWEDHTYGEKYCHSCGIKAETSKAHPLCSRCETNSNLTKNE